MERSGIPSGEHGEAVQGLSSPVPPSGRYSFRGGDLSDKTANYHVNACRDTPNGFNAMNQKLKERVEGKANSN